MRDELRRVVDAVLIDGLPASLKESIDRLLAAGEPKERIMETIRAAAGRAAGGDPNKGRLTVAAAEAYLESK